MVRGLGHARFALEQASAATALADAVPDPFAKRLIARGVFVALHSFVDLSRRARNEVAKTTANRQELEAIKQALNALAERDWGPYQPLRDRIAAHRQPVGGEDGAAGWAEANALFAQIDRPLVHILVDDACEIFDRLARFSSMGVFSPPTIPPAVESALATAFTEPRQAAAAIATGSFGETQTNTLAVIQGGAIGERLRQVGDALDGWETWCAVSVAVGAERRLWRAAMAGALIEVANVVELIYELPPGRAADHRYPPLLELLPSSHFEATELQAEYSRLDPAEIVWVRGLRNTVAAHIDGATPIAEILRRLDELDPQRLSDLFLETANALSRIDHRHSITVFSPFVRLRGAALSDVRRLDPPTHPRGYAD
ncbi:MAG TPA: hypothetical protein VK501_22350 [Baekduia sp.]|uniref:hypothetical protein n=1 Tax=Baekduia sp. TaxID=2600305 RepID=UPI002D008906|nr:hypothetical protein [Baekduia sp.]HMJ36663.1 hypothetical protein [Baekduia sp.]